jgi:hypothetical protein
MISPTTLEGWLARLETLHPKAIAMGLERVALVHSRMDAGLSVSRRDRHRNERQGLDVRDARSRSSAAPGIGPASTRRRISSATTSASGSMAKRRTTPR